MKNPNKYSLILKQMQMAYLAAKLERESKAEGDTCGRCWSKSCTCGYSVESDPFINLTEELSFI